jgi:hypothetical protein
MSAAGLESAIQASERPKTHALDRAINGIDYAGSKSMKILQIFIKGFKFEEARFQITGCMCS